MIKLGHKYIIFYWNNTGNILQKFFHEVACSIESNPCLVTKEAATKLVQQAKGMVVLADAF